MKIISNRKLPFLVLLIITLMITSYVLSTHLSSIKKPVMIKGNSIVIHHKNPNSEINRIFGLTLIIPLSGFLISLILSFIPYKNFKWSEKYIPFALLSILAILILSVISLSLKVLTF